MKLHKAEIYYNQLRAKINKALTVNEMINIMTSDIEHQDIKQVFYKKYRKETNMLGGKIEKCRQYFIKTCNINEHRFFESEYDL